MSERPMFESSYGSYDLWCINSFSLVIFSSIKMELKYLGIQCCYKDHVEDMNIKCLVWYLAFTYSVDVPTFSFFADSCPAFHLKR